jgi:hypothetical protein
MLMVNLSDSPPVDSFSPEQRTSVLFAARFIAKASIWGDNDPVALEQLADIERQWSQG